MKSYIIIKHNFQDKLRESFNSSKSSGSVHPNGHQGNGFPMIPEMNAPTVNYQTPVMGAGPGHGMGLGFGMSPGMGLGMGAGMLPAMDVPDAPMFDGLQEPSLTETPTPVDPEAMMNAMNAAMNAMRFRQWVGISANLAARWKNKNILGQFEVNPPDQTGVT